MSESQEYWEARKARELYEELVAVEEMAEMFRRIYLRASNEIQQEAIKIVRRFQLEHHLSQKEAERLLSTILDARDIDALIAALKRDPRNEELVAALESQAYAARLKRLQELQAMVDSLALQLIREIEPDAVEMLEEIGRAMYYREIFAMQQRAGVGFSFSPLDPERIKQILATPWLGSNFSERLWGNTKALAEAVKEEILISVLTGKSQHRMAQEIEKKFSAGANASRRLIRTEANYVANQLQIESYKATGVQKYIYVAILDLRTSEICRRLDKKEFPVAEAQAGKNLPPMHPWCRSTTIAWMPRELLSKLEQSAIDPVTGEMITVPGDMTYEEWYDKYVKDNPAVVIQEKSYKNRSADTRQYESYKAVLGDQLPDTVYEFQKIKYNNSEEWERLKGLKRYLTKYQNSDSRYYDAMLQLKREGIDHGVLLPPTPKQAFILPEGKRDPYHIMHRMLERGLTDDGIRGYMQNARGKFVQWGGRRQLFISDDGVSLIARSKDGWVYKTAWSKHDFDEETERTIEVLKNAGL